MQTEIEQREQQMVLDALLATGALRETAARHNAGDDFIRQRSALFGMRVALPMALCLWALIAALVWFCLH